MRKLTPLFILTIISILYVPTLAIYSPDNNSINADRQPFQLIIKFNDSMEKMSANKSSALNSLNELNAKYGVQSMNLFMAKQRQAPSHKSFDNIYLLRSQAGSDLETMASEYRNLPFVEYVEPDYFVELHELPNDSLFLHLWGLHNIGQEHYFIQRNYGNTNDELLLTTGIDDADIKYDDYYQNRPDNTSTVIVAIIDTGVDLDHPDLAANIWVNEREIPDNGIDDDHNGYIDDLYGWDYAKSTDPLDPGDNDPTDQFGHGTHVAGTIAAVTNNGIGIAGIASNCKIMTLNFDPLPLTSRIVASILYAADNGADVINMSFGLTYRSDILNEAIEYASRKGVIMCASSGNSGDSTISYPAGYPETITVGSSNDSDHVSTFSTYGDYVDVVAPGEAIVSLRANTTDMYGGSYPYERNVHIIDSIYYIASGTSMSSPHVVGVAAEMRSVSPGLTPDSVRSIIRSTADDIVDPFGVGWNLPGYDIYSGYGRINMANALNAVPSTKTIISSPDINDIVSGNIDIIGTAEGGTYTLEYGSGNNPEIWQPISESSIPVTDGLLGQWNSSGMNGLYTIRLSLGNSNRAYRTVFVVNEDTAEITRPADGDTVSNYLAIAGNAFSAGFQTVTAEYSPVTDTLEWTEIYTGSIPVFNETISGWFLEGIEAGEYYLRMTVLNNDSTTITDSIMIHIQSIFSTENAWKSDLSHYPSIIPNYGDFDGDGQNEILIGTSGAVEFFNTDGTPKTENIPFFPRNNYMIPIAVGDLDNDDIDDIAAIGANPPMIYTYISEGGSFEYYLAELPQVNVFFNTEHEFPKIFLKDIDSDGIDEIHFFNYNRDLSTSYLIDASGQLINEFNYYSEYLPADLNGDGIDEIYACNRNFCLLRQIDPFTGETVDSLLVQKDGSNFNVQGISAVDIDDDQKYELILFGYFPDYGYYIYAFDEGLQIIDGWPHSMNSSDYLVPTMPVFGDLDGDNIPEYASTFFDISASYVLAWRIDGTPLIPGNDDGLFVTTPEPAVMNMLLLADVSGDGLADIVACADNDMFNTFSAQRIYAWDYEARPIDGFPIITMQNRYTNERFTPVTGDINGDGYIDLAATTPDSSGIFINFAGIPYDTCSSPAPAWRYSRKLNGIAPFICDNSTDVTDSKNDLIPASFSLEANYPNPFNNATEISFSVPARSRVTIEIFNLLGRRVKQLIDDSYAAGSYSIIWDGTDQNGQPTASGIYLYRMRAGDFTDAKKMIYLK